jgi:hypothetical protein
MSPEKPKTSINIEERKELACLEVTDSISCLKIAVKPAKEDSLRISDIDEDECCDISERDDEYYNIIADQDISICQKLSQPINIAEGR